MQKVNLRSLDLNLLTILHQLLIDKHITQASVQLNMSQPAVSRALQRLRTSFNDPLLVKTSNGYTLSSRAKSIQPELARILSGVEKMIEPPSFDPNRSTKTVKFIGPDPELTTYLPPLFSNMRRLAPNMSLSAVSTPNNHFQPLEQGLAHFVISPFKPSANTDQFRYKILDSFDLVAVMSKDHRLANKTLSHSEFLAAAHGLVSITGRGESMLANSLNLTESSINYQVQLTSFTAIGDFCEQSDVIFILPENYANSLSQRYQIVCKALPLSLNLQQTEIALYWHDSFHHDPMRLWLVQQLANAD